MARNTSDVDGTSPDKVKLWELFLEFLIIGAVSFGGGIVAYEKILLTEKKRWLSDDEFMAALAISQTMPGLNAVNLAVLAGDKLRGAMGSVVATIGLLIPGCSFVLVVGLVYLESSNHPVANMLLTGVAAAATGLLSAITFRIGKRQFSEIKPLIILIATFFLMSFAGLSLPAVLGIMAPIAIFMYRPKSTTTSGPTKASGDAP
jgi:chromate transporter